MGMPYESDPALARLAAAVERTAELTAGRAATGVSHDDADDVLGTIATDDARNFDPRPVLQALHRAGARAVVIGQVAGIMHGSTELTGDLDILWDGDRQNAPALARAFSALGTTLHDDDGTPVPCATESFHGPKVLFSCSYASGDCCTPALPWGNIPVAEFLTRARVAVSVAGYEIAYLDRDDLIRMRRAVGRPKDLRRAEELERLASN